jgi:NADH:ubiquinone oxidoreductase subunit F (NADH-binding)
MTFYFVCCFNFSDFHFSSFAVIFLFLEPDPYSQRGSINPSNTDRMQISGSVALLHPVEYGLKLEFRNMIFNSAGFVRHERGEDGVIFH